MPSKKCSKCKKHKDVSQFHKDASNPTGYYSSCKACRKLQSRVYYQKHSPRQKKRREDARDYIYDILADSCCANCGETDLWLLEFDHIDPEEKTANISQMSSWSLDAIDREIDKCDVLCVRCHRMKTAVEQDWYFLKYLQKRQNKLEGNE